MKMILEVDLDFYEEGNIGSIIQQRIFREAIKKAEDNIIKQIREIADNRLSKKIDNLIDEAVSNFSDREIILTDQYGDVKQRYENVDEMLKERFDNFLDEKVDSKGKSLKDRCSYGKTFTRIEYILDERIQGKADKMTQEIVDRLEKAMTQQLNRAVREKITDYLIKKINISEAITNAIEEKKDDSGKN